MKKSCKKSIILVTIISLCVYIVSKIVFRNTFLIYNVDDNNIYYKGDSHTLLEQVVNPSMIGTDKIIGTFIKESPFIGIYDMNSGIVEMVYYVDELNEVLGGEMEAEEISMLQCVGEETTIISFVFEKKLYKYGKNGVIEEVWEFNRPMAEKSYIWVDEFRVLLLDECEILNDWKLLLVDLATDEVMVVDNNVSAFDVSEKGIVYSKKYYMGAWCEWELHFIDTNLNQTKEPIRNKFWSIGNVVYGADGDIYMQPDKSGVVGVEAIEIYQLNHLIWKRSEVGKINPNERLLQVK